MVDPLKDLPGYALRRVSAREMAILARRLGALGLRPTEASVLMMIAANPGITQSEIGRHLDIASANMAPLIGKLFKRNLMHRERVDGRSHGLTLTETGLQLNERMSKVVRQCEAALVAKIPRTHRKAFLQALQAIWSPEQD